MKSLREYLNEKIDSKYTDKLNDLSDERGRKIFLSEIMKVDTSYGNKLPAGIRNKYDFDQSATMDISKLVATQTSVEIDQVKNILDNFNRKLVNVKVLNDGNKFYIVDGHHTVAALSILGKDNKIPVKIHKVEK